MQDYKNHINNTLLIRLIKEKLDWYIDEASDEEYEEAEVEELQRALNELEPLDEDAFSDVDDAWDRFWTAVEADAEAGAVAVSDTENVICAKRLTDTENTKKADEYKKHRIIKFVLRHKSVVAAGVLILVLAVGKGIQTEAFQNSGFFMWLKNDESGMQMVTSPDGLDGETELIAENIYYKKDEVPDWAKEWADIETKIMKNYEYEWIRIETNDQKNKSIVNSYYELSAKKIVLGVIYYKDKITMNTKTFVKYDFIKYIDKNQELSVYRGTSEKEMYIIAFFARNMHCYVAGEELEEVEDVAIRYLNEMRSR